VLVVRKKPLFYWHDAKLSRKNPQSLFFFGLLFAQPNTVYSVARRLCSVETVFFVKTLSMYVCCACGWVNIYSGPAHSLASSPFHFDVFPVTKYLRQQHKASATTKIKTFSANSLLALLSSWATNGSVRIERSVRDRFVCYAQPESREREHERNKKKGCCSDTERFRLIFLVFWVSRPCRKIWLSIFCELW